MSYRSTLDQLRVSFTNNINRLLAERVGFEPTRPLRAHTRSRRAPSATRPPLRTGAVIAPNTSNASLSMR
jgi:hypothetical protein